MKFLLYVLEGCPYCQGAVRLLQQRGQQYKTIVVPPHMKDQIKRRNGMNTFPQIYLEQKGTKQMQRMGGFNELQQFLR